MELCFHQPGIAWDHKKLEKVILSLCLSYPFLSIGIQQKEKVQQVQKEDEGELKGRGVRGERKKKRNQQYIKERRQRSSQIHSFKPLFNYQVKIFDLSG